jgi:hypothetical protein
MTGAWSIASRATPRFLISIASDRKDTMGDTKVTAVSGIEQQAKELAERIATEVLYHIDEMYPNMWEGVPNAARLSVRNTILRQDWRVAAALAACAREEAQRIYTNWNVADRDFEKWLKAHIAALERAVGEEG